MNNGWRSRYLAPVYALVVSFVFVFILGAVALDDPLRIQFNVPEPEGPNQQIDELSHSSVRVETIDGHKKLTNQQLDVSREFTLLNPHEKIQICTRLPEGWVADPPEGQGEPQSHSCWSRGGLRGGFQAEDGQE